MELEAFRSELFLLTRDVQHVMHDIVAPICQDHRLTPQQMHILMELSREPGQTAGQLSDRTGILKTNFSSVCRRLEEGGLIERHRSERDGRAYEFRVTKAGCEMLKAIDGEIRQRFGDALDDTSPETLDTIIAGLRALSGLSAKLVV